MTGGPFAHDQPLTRMTKPETLEDPAGRPGVEPLVGAWPGAKAWRGSCWRDQPTLCDLGLSVPRSHAGGLVPDPGRVVPSSSQLGIAIIGCQGEECEQIVCMDSTSPLLISASLNFAQIRTVASVPVVRRWPQPVGLSLG